VMNVYIEPKDWDESQGPRPISQLEIRTRSFIGVKAEEVKGPQAISNADGPCMFLHVEDLGDAHVLAY
jgi:hypothetical protein